MSVDAEFVEGLGGGINADYLIFPETARNFEAEILADLRRGYNVRVIFQQPVRIGPLMVAPEVVEAIREQQKRGLVVRWERRLRRRKKRKGSK